MIDPFVAGERADDVEPIDAAGKLEILRTFVSAPASAVH
jgi:hypothetical protein